MHTGTLDAKKNSLTNKDQGNHTMSETVKNNNKHSSVKEDTEFLQKSLSIVKELKK